MAKGSGGTRGASGGGSSRSKGFNLPEGFTDVQTVKEALMQYANMDKWNKNTEYQMGFNDDAMGVIESIAKGDHGLATTIAKDLTSRPNWNKYGANLSEKQAYVLAKAAVEGKHVPQKTIFDKSIKIKAQQAQAAKAAAHAAKWEAYSKTYTKSSTKVAVGSKVWDAKGKSGTISSIITKSSGYVTVKYDDGSVSKQMAFNLKGSDGNPLKKRPK